MPHQSCKTITLVTLIALVAAHTLNASFDSLIEGLGLSKDSQIASTRSRLSFIFDVKEGPKPPARKGDKIEVKRTPFEQVILKLHKSLVDLGVETHPRDRELWRSFLINMNAFMGVGESVKPVFRKNQIAQLGKELSQLLEFYQRDLVAYFSREKPQLLGKAISEVDNIEARYLALFNIHRFMAKYWANDQVDYVAPLMMSAMQLAQAKLIEDVFECQYSAQLSQQREERRKIKFEREKERLEEERRLKQEKEKEKAEEENLEKEKPEKIQESSSTPKEETKKNESHDVDPQEKVERPVLPSETETPAEPEDPEITRDEITLKHIKVLEKLKGRFLPEDVKLWDPESDLTYEALKELVQKYQTPFDEIASLAFPKPKLPEPKKEEPKGAIEEGSAKTEEPEVSIKEEKEEVAQEPHYKIPKPLKAFKYPGIFSTLKEKLGLKQADYYLFLKCLGLLEEMNIEGSDKKSLMEKLKGKWQRHITQGRDSNPEKVKEDKQFEEFLKAYSEWSIQNKTLSEVRRELAPSQTLAGSYNHFMKEHGGKLKDKKEDEVKQLLNRIVGQGAWEYHQSLQKKSEPKESLKPIEENLRTIWVESILKAPNFDKKALDSVSDQVTTSFKAENFIF